ncbi:MAG TPA: D-tyrosyl-tRNA(Tyr) deacylase [Candidatus Omnitrophica bacterium]|nr:MAG: D-tyrosyl-tRNA(Tyr) deacylase [Omnitrophica WOR_2 bacterium GWA2_45_18]HBR14811.1 D-tyrosyl-tRNA(Tyr) deacylase [Candidatus Omnitrophota bacterium]
MKIVIQRVKQAEVEVHSKVVGKISKGLLIFLGVGQEDTPAEADYFAGKIVQLRMFEDDNGKMNLSALETGAELLVVSQFTLYGDCQKGRRPSFDQAAEPKKAETLYHYFVEQLRKHPLKVETGQFQAMMDVKLVNDGPVTFILESAPLKEKPRGRKIHGASHAS